MSWKKWYYCFFESFPAIIKFYCYFAGWTGLFCPCVLFGRNVETLRDDIPWTNACVCHAICVEGGMAVAAATALLHGIDPKTSFLICESLFFAWWMCGIYTGLFRQSLQKQYHLKVNPRSPWIITIDLNCLCIKSFIQTHAPHSYQIDGLK